MLSTVLLAILLIQSSIAGYVLVDNYEPSTFFEMFDFYTGSDPTDGTGLCVEFRSLYQSNMLYSRIRGSKYSAIIWTDLKFKLLCGVSRRFQTDHGKQV